MKIRQWEIDSVMLGLGKLEFNSLIERLEILVEAYGCAETENINPAWLESAIRQTIGLED